MHGWISQGLLRIWTEHFVESYFMKYPYGGGGGVLGGPHMQLPHQLWGWLVWTIIL